MNASEDRPAVVKRQAGDRKKLAADSRGETRIGHEREDQLENCVHRILSGETDLASVFCKKSVLFLIRVYPRENPRLMFELSQHVSNLFVMTLLVVTDK
jgi:hypothetical protein